MHDRTYLPTYSYPSLSRSHKDPKLTTRRTEREALRWIQKYISAFGGDPRKVMM